MVWSELRLATNEQTKWAFSLGSFDSFIASEIEISESLPLVIIFCAWNLRQRVSYYFEYIKVYVMANIST